MPGFVNILIRRFPNLVALALRVPFIHSVLNKRLINKFCHATKPRPRPFSLVSSYTSWKSLTDKTYTGRHLPQDDSGRALPDIDEVVDLWKRRDKTEIPSFDTSMLFSFFAQWFTDSFLRTDLNDRRKNFSNHQIDFCQLYGMNEAQTDLLRSGEGGKLASQVLNGEEFPPYLFDRKKTTKDKWVFAKNGKKSFKNLHSEDKLKFVFRNATDETIKDMFVTGLEHGNSNVGYTLLNVIALREHNRVCDLLLAAYPEWDDERLFQTARNIMIVLLLKIVAGDYIKHIATVSFPFEVKPGMAEKEPWYRTNWITLEFDLLYRWHSMVPEKMEIGDGTYGQDEYRTNPGLLLKHGINGFVASASRQLAGKIGLHNSPDFFFDPLPHDPSTSIHKNTVLMGRDQKLRSMNEYREAFKLKKLTSFEELTDDPALCAELKRLYNNRIDDVEWHVGIFAEKHKDGAMLGDLMTEMVAYDAFTHALTNPLLSENVYNSDTFSEKGMEIIGQTNSFADFVKRNLSDASDVPVSFSARAEVPGSYGWPVVGMLWDTVDFLFVSGWTRFFAKRREKYQSTIYKVNLFEPTIVVSDKLAFDVFHNWDGRLRKDYGFGWAVPPAALTSGKRPSVFLPNPEHENYKTLYMSLLKDNAPRFSSTFDTLWKEHTDRWVSENKFSLAQEIERLTAAFVFEWYFSARPEVDDVRAIYNNIFLHKPLGLLKLLPWSSYNASVPKAEKLHEFVKTSPGYSGIAEKAAEMGLKDEDALVSQLTFLVGMNNFLGLQGMSKALIGELTRNPDVANALKDEFDRLKSDKGGKDLDLAEIAKIKLLDNVMKEVMRLHPPVFFIYGRANEDFDLASSSGTFAIKKDEHLMGVIPLVQNDAANYEDPDMFSPQRFDQDKADHALIWPHGMHDDTVSATGHICPGKDVAMLYGKQLAYALLQGFEWSFEEAVEWDAHKFSLNVASPKGEMRTFRFAKRK